jgi:hypothetical protein
MGRNKKKVEDGQSQAKENIHFIGYECFAISKAYVPHSE